MIRLVALLIAPQGCVPRFRRQDFKMSEADLEDLRWYHPRPKLVVAQNVRELIHVLLNTRTEDRDDIAEVCGGAA